MARSADLRYFGQRYEVNVTLPRGDLGPGAVTDIETAFYVAYRQHYGREIHEVPVETVSWRVTVSGPRPTLSLAWPGEPTNGAGVRPKGRSQQQPLTLGYLQSRHGRPRFM